MLNPVFRREAITSLRNWKIYGVIMFHVFIIALAAMVFLWVNMGFSVYNTSFEPQTVVYFYIMLSAFQTALILITTPALCAGSISGERERQTLDLLLITKMSPIALIIGKLMSGIGLVVLMSVSTLPVFAIVFYFGGISIFAFIQMAIFMITLSCMAGAISIFMSTIFKKSMISTVVVYLIIGGLTLGTLFIAVIFMAWYYSYLYSMNPAGGIVISAFANLLVNVLLMTNPGVAFFSLVDSQFGFGIVDQVVYSGTWGIIKNIWVYNILFNIITTAVFVILASKCINPLKRK